jgi:hypothetical protein
VYGLQGMRSADPGVKEILPALLKALTQKINDSEAELDAQHIGNAVYGLKGMRSADPGVPALLKALTDKINASEAELYAQAIGNAVYGLKGMRSADPGVPALLEALTKKISKSEAKLDAQAIGNAVLIGLQNLDDLQQVTSVLSALSGLAARHRPSQDDLSIKKIIHTHFDRLFMQPHLFDAKLECLYTIIYVTQDRDTHVTQDRQANEADFLENLSRCISPSDYRQLQSMEQPLHADSWTKKITDFINSSELAYCQKLRSYQRTIDTAIRGDRTAATSTGIPADFVHLARESRIAEIEQEDLTKIPQTDRAVLQKELKDLTRQRPINYGSERYTFTCEDQLPSKDYTNLHSGSEDLETIPADTVIMLPTRGQAPDVDVITFLRAVSDSFKDKGLQHIKV